MATFLIAVVIFLRSGGRDASEFTDSLRKASSELSGRIAESSAGVREGVSEKLSASLGEIRDRVGAELKAGREEASRANTAATEAVIKRLGEFGSATESRIAALEKKTSESLEAIREKVDLRLLEIGKQVQAKLDENIKEGFAHFEKVSEHLKKAENQLAGLSVVGASINELNGLLKLPHLRGGFGEAALELLLTEFLPKELYELQAPIGGNRVDVLVKLEELEIVENVADNLSGLIVERDLQDPNRLDAKIPCDVVNGLHVFAGRIDLLL